MVIKDNVKVEAVEASKKYIQNYALHTGVDNYHISPTYRVSWSFWDENITKQVKYSSAIIWKWGLSSGQKAKSFLEFLKMSKGVEGHI